MENEIRKAIQEVLTELNFPSIDSTIDFVVEHPTELSHGDYATNVTMVIMRSVAKKASDDEIKISTQNVILGGALSPKGLAKIISEKLEGKIPHIEKIEIAGTGFINFYLDSDFFGEKITETLKNGDEWGKNDTWKGKKVIVEYTDPNPFKEFHIGHLFTNSVGESIARLFMMNGADTKRVNYQGDVGMHVAKAIWGMQKQGITAEGDFSPKNLGEAYSTGATAYEEYESAKKEIIIISR